MVCGREERLCGGLDEIVIRLTITLLCVWRVDVIRERKKAGRKGESKSIFKYMCVIKSIFG